MKLLGYVSQLATKLQADWELSQLLHYRNLADTAPAEDTRKYCRSVLKYMAQGVHDFRRNYRVDEKDGLYRIVYDCNVTGMKKIHCVVSKDTGDVARFTTELVNEASFPYNLNDLRSREAALAIADYDGEYLH